MKTHARTNTLYFFIIIPSFFFTLFGFLSFACVFMKKKKTKYKKSNAAVKFDLSRRFGGKTDYLFFLFFSFLSFLLSFGEKPGKVLT